MKTDLPSSVYLRCPYRMLRYRCVTLLDVPPGTPASAPRCRLVSILNANRCNMARYLLLLIATLCVVSPVFAADKALEAFLPASCAPGWVMDGKAATYTPENLYKYIDGEAELYMPYGFSKAATVLYAKPDTKDIGIVTNIFEMGSPLDAFGIYANFRSPTLEQIKVGAEGFFDESQLMFYQDRYFVQIEASGSITQEGPLFRSCAEAISRNLPDGKERPRELEFLKVPGAVPLTERYYAGGLLGHDFFGKGFTVEIMIGQTRAKAILISGTSEEAARRVFTEYEKYLKKSNAEPRISSDKGGAVLHVIDPHYKGVVMHQSGHYVVGVVGLKEPHEGDVIVAQLVKRLPGRQ
jgi:hypothetical protein